MRRVRWKDGGECPGINRICHLERNEVESRDLRTFEPVQSELVRRSLDSLRSLGMTSFVGKCDKLQNV